MSQAQLDNRTLPGSRSAVGMRVLWIAPNLNDYKSRFLDALIEASGMQMTVLAGSALTTEGHRYEVTSHRFKRLNTRATKRAFGISPRTFWASARLSRSHQFEVVLMPIEKKHLPLILFLMLLRWLYGFKLVTYNHPCLKSRGGRITRLDLALTRFLFAAYDFVIFYTEGSRTWAIEKGLVDAEKTSYASNTLDTGSIWAGHSFQVNQLPPHRLLFIGRLLKAKRIDLLFEHFDNLRQKLPEVELTIIGDGPESPLVAKRAESDRQVEWLGAITEELSIKAQMDRACAVFIPCHSGLSVVHAFSYGKPYLTLMLPDSNHGPEIDYVVDSENGLLLNGEIEQNASRILDLLTSNDRYASMCHSAFLTAKTLSVSNWADQITASFVRVTGEDS